MPYLHHSHDRFAALAARLLSYVTTGQGHSLNFIHGTQATYLNGWIGFFLFFHHRSSFLSCVPSRGDVVGVN